MQLLIWNAALKQVGTVAGLHRVHLLGRVLEADGRRGLDLVLAPVEGPEDSDVAEGADDDGEAEPNAGYDSGKKFSIPW